MNSMNEIKLKETWIEMKWNEHLNEWWNGTEWNGLERNGTEWMEWNGLEWNEWVNEWLIWRNYARNEWMNECKDGKVQDWMNGWLIGGKNEWMNQWINQWRKEWMIMNVSWLLTSKGLQWINGMRDCTKTMIEWANERLARIKCMKEEKECLQPPRQKLWSKDMQCFCRPCLQPLQAR